MEEKLQRLMSEKLRFGRAMSDNLFCIVIMVLLELCLLL